MDIFKLLSRSSGLHSSAAAARAQRNAPLPSQGPSMSPQLFSADGDVRKRKRARADESGMEEQVNVDFFGPKVTTDRDDVASTSKNVLQNEPKLASAMEDLDEAACKQILKSHKLKITLFSSEKAAKTHMQIYPQPLQSFGALRPRYGLSRRLAQNIAAQRYTLPTEVQMGSLPLLLEESALSHRDLLVVAPTGSGKTIAFLIPLVHDLLRKQHTELKNGRGIRSIILAPTKELAGQIVNEGRKLAVGTALKVTRMTKDMRFCDQHSLKTDRESSGSESDTIEKATLSSPDILVATPMMLLHTITPCAAKSCNPLSRTTHLICDEADVLLDRLFQKQTLGIWNACTNEELKTSLWSATMGSSIEKLALETIHAREERLNTQPRKIVRLVVGRKDSTIPNITHKLVYAATEPGKLLALRQYLHPATSVRDGSMPVLHPPFLVFTQTIPRAIALHSELLYDIPAEAGGSSRIAVLHADLSDHARESIMDRFRAGEIWVLITTDLLSRGVDFRGVNAVVNYDIPTTAASYIHRAGRTGRAGRSGGVAVTLYTKEDIQHVKSIANVIAVSEKQAKSEGRGEGLLEPWLLDSLPQPSKKTKKKLKFHGAAERQSQDHKGEEAGKGQRRARISTKSGYQRRLEDRTRGMKSGTAGKSDGAEVSSDSEWDGIAD